MCDIHQIWVLTYANLTPYVWGSWNHAICVRHTGYCSENSTKFQSQIQTTIHESGTGDSRVFWTIARLHQNDDNVHAPQTKILEGKQKMKCAFSIDLSMVRLPNLVLKPLKRCISSFVLIPKHSLGSLTLPKSVAGQHACRACIPL